MEVFVFVFLSDNYAQNTGRYRIMFYNVENFFDIEDDTLTEDESFLPDGVMRWNYSRYLKKLNSLYRTIVAAGEWDLPTVIAMCEIENRRVLQDLIYKTNLMKYQLGIIHEESPDPRGIDVCLLYNRETTSVLSYRYFVPEVDTGTAYRSRSVLYSKLLIADDTLHLLVNHWPSRRGGALSGMELRGRISAMVRNICDSITSVSRGKIIICGDFNSTPEDNVIRSLSGASNDGGLVNLSANAMLKGRGSYRYRGAWEMIDQFIVSNSLLNNESGLMTSPGGVRIPDLPFLLEKDPVYPGDSPYRTYRGYRYNGGFSDHLPVLLDVSFH